MASEQFSLCWDNFHKNMSSGMHSLLENEDLVDVTLAIEGQYIKAHKMVLSVCSPYFRTLFAMNPCQHPIVFMKDVSYSVMNDLLTFMYQGEVQVAQEHLGMFIKTAEALQVKGLTGDNNESEETTNSEETKQNKRPNTELKTIRKFVAPPAKKPKLATSTTSAAATVSTTHTSTVKEPKNEAVSTSSEELVQFKMEPYESMTDHSQSEGFDQDNQDAYGEDTMDESHADEPEDYGIMEGEEEPQAGPSSEGITDSQGYIIVRKGKRQPICKDGFFYCLVKNVPQTNRCYYKCVNQSRLGCQVTAVLPRDANTKGLRVRGRHNHPPDPATQLKQSYLVDLHKAVQAMPELHFRTIYNNFIMANPEAEKMIPFTLSLSARMKRWRHGASLGSV